MERGFALLDPFDDSSMEWLAWLHHTESDSHSIGSSFAAKVAFAPPMSSGHDNGSQHAQLAQPGCHTNSAHNHSDHTQSLTALDELTEYFPFACGMLRMQIDLHAVGLPNQPRLIPGSIYCIHCLGHVLAFTVD